jgi:hypothetical protein
MASVVYFIAAGSPPEAVKIGYTLRDAGARLNGIQTSNHLEVRLLGTIPGDRGVERALHRRFAHLRLRGEWFRWDASIKAFIDSDPDFPLADLRADSPFVGLFGRGFEQRSFYRVFVKDPWDTWWRFEDRTDLVVHYDPVVRQHALTARGLAVETFYGKLSDAARFDGHPYNAALLRALARARELAA